MAKGGSSALDAQKTLFECLDINCTVQRIEARYRNSGRGRRRYPVRAMLLALMLMYLLQIPSITMLSTMLARYGARAHLKPIHGILWVGLHLDSFIERMNCWKRYMK